MNLILCDDDHQRGDARDGANGENDEQLKFPDAIHPDFPLHDYGGGQQTKSERDVNEHHAKSDFETYDRVAVFEILRLSYLKKS